MEAFNIKINTKGKEMTLTILPIDLEYQIIYYGGIIGALKQSGTELQFIEPEDTTPGHLPLYSYKQSDSPEDEPEFKMDKQALAQIIDAVKGTIGQKVPST